MAARELLFAGIAVVDGDEESALDDGGDFRSVGLRNEWDLKAIAGIGVDAVTVEKFQCFPGWMGPRFPTSFQRDGENLGSLEFRPARHRRIHWRR